MNPERENESTTIHAVHVCTHEGISTTVTSTLFEYLRFFGVPVAYYGKNTYKSFIAPECRVLPFILSVQREAGELVQHTLLNTSGLKRWGKYDLFECANPIMRVNGSQCELYNPTKPLTAGGSFVSIPRESIMGVPDQCLLSQMEQIIPDIFLKVERIRRTQGSNEPVRLKARFGVSRAGTLLLTDVVDGPIRKESRMCLKKKYDRHSLQKTLTDHPRDAEVLHMLETFERDMRGELD